MRFAPLRPNESASLAALREMQVLDTEPEAPFDALVNAAAAVCGTPISLISLIDNDRQWFKANLGLNGVTETPRELAFCAHAVLIDDILEVPDTRQDERFVDNPLVAADPNIRFYAGMPLRIKDGSTLGALCVIDRQPRRLDDRQREVLRQLALAAVQMLEGRLAMRRQLEAHRDLAGRLQSLRLLVDLMPSMLAYLNADLTYRFANHAYANWFGWDPAALEGLHVSQLLGLEHYERNRPRYEAALKGQTQTFEVRWTAPDGATRHRLTHYLPDNLNGVVNGLLIEANDITSLKMAEHRASTLLDERDRLAMVARLTSNAVMITDTQRRITWVNPGFERLTGYSAEEAIGHTPMSLLQSEQTDPATIERLIEAQDAGQAISCEILNRSKTGRAFWSMKEIQPMHDAAGQLAGFMTIESDITERRKAEATIRASQSILETAGRIGGIGGWAINPKTGAIDFTQQTRRILDVLPGHNPTLAECASWCAPQARDLLAQIIHRGVSGAPWDFELPVITIAGRSILLRLVAECERTDGGELRIVGAIQDITDRRAVETEAKRNHELLRCAIDAVDEAFVLFDPEDRLVFCNDKYRSIYSITADLIVPGVQFEDLIRGASLRGQHPEAIGREDAWVAERLAVHRAGNRKTVQTLANGRTLRIVEHKMPDGHQVGFRIDITDLVRATEDAEEASRAKSEFIATMSHELRTPLQSVNGYAELGQHIALDEGQHHYASMFGVVLRGGQRMLSLVNDLLDLSAIDAKTLALSHQHEDLKELTRQICEELEPLAQARGLSISQMPSMPALPVIADAGRLQQVIRNVLANAIRFSPPGMAVLIDGNDLGARGIELTVRDHGPGIPPDELELVFDAFVQSSRTRDGSGGSGLGLAISRRIMTAHGGTITAENAPLAGALLRLHLPSVPQQCELSSLDAADCSQCESIS